MAVRVDETLNLGNCSVVAATAANEFAAEMGNALKRVLAGVTRFSGFFVPAVEFIRWLGEQV